MEEYADIMEARRRKREQREKEMALESAKIARENKRVTTLVIVIMSMLVLIICAAIVYMTLKKNGISLFAQTAAPENNTIQISSYNADFVSVDGNLTDVRVSDDPLSNRQVYYAGFDDFTVGEGNVVYLENLRENEDIFMAYEIYVGDELIHKTGLIPSGQYSEWIPATDMNAGTYQISIKNVPYYSYNGTDYFVLAYQPINTVQMTIIK